MYFSFGLGKILMKITKEQLISLLDKEEYSLLELQNLMNSFFSAKEIDLKKILAGELTQSFKYLLSHDPFINNVGEKKDILHKLYVYLENVSYSFYEHLQNTALEQDEEVNVPKHFSSLEECRLDILKKILTVASLLELNFHKILFCGYEPCMEEYACACEFMDYLDSLDDYTEANVEELEETLGSCVDMVAPKKEDRVPFYRSLLQVKASLLKDE
jgi:hypothetical protein